MVEQSVDLCCVVLILGSVQGYSPAPVLGVMPFSMACCD
jgi:hypothetical protein